MASETIKIENGTLKVERIAGKESLEVSLSDVDTVSFERSGEANGDGTLVICTKDGERHAVRVADNEVSKYLKAISDGDKPKPVTKADAK